MLAETYRGETSGIDLLTYTSATVFCLERAAASVSSRTGYGTQVEVTLPVMSKEEMERYVQGIHR